jgi:FAD/FMN-containing dehydrogenase
MNRTERPITAADAGFRRPRRDAFESWGRLPARAQAGITLWNRTDPLPAASGGSVLPHGRGRSYGDCCLNSEGLVLATCRLDRFIEFDAAEGIVTCESGVTLGDIIDSCLPVGWSLPVVPGTQFVSVGGAIANDVHGKNHHRVGTFGNHVIKFELLRSNGERLTCSEQDNQGWFRATIGGLGLTGLITWAQLRLRKINSALLEVEDIPFSSLESFWSLSEESDRDFEYTVAWFDCYSYDSGRLRGIFSRARPLDEFDGTLAQKRPHPRLAVPRAMPGWLLNPAAVRLFNRAYHAAKRGRGIRQLRMDSFLFPLDAIRNWNRLYGPMGFMQLQCVFTVEASLQGAADLLQAISSSGEGSFLSVLKRFGGQRSPGLLSFPQPGITVALDFPSRGPGTRALLERCQDIVMRYGGRIYPAKDSCMTPANFNAGYPAWRDLVPYIDPRFSSSFWRRTAGAFAA